MEVIDAVKRFKEYIREVYEKKWQDFILYRKNEVGFHLILRRDRTIKKLKIKNYIDEITDTPCTLQNQANIPLNYYGDNKYVYNVHTHPEFCSRYLRELNEDGVIKEYKLKTLCLPSSTDIEQLIIAENFNINYDRIVHVIYGLNYFSVYYAGNWLIHELKKLKESKDNEKYNKLLDILPCNTNMQQFISDTEDFSLSLSLSQEDLEQIKKNFKDLPGDLPPNQYAIEIHVFPYVSSFLEELTECV